MVAARRLQQLGLEVTVLEKSVAEGGFGNAVISGGLIHVAWEPPDSPPDVKRERLIAETEGAIDPALADATWPDQDGDGARGLGAPHRAEVDARRAWAYLKELQEDGCALVICTHSMEEAEMLAGSIGIMSAGRALAVGDLAELRRRSGLQVRREMRELPTLQDIYLAIVGNRHELAEPVSA